MKAPKIIVTSLCYAKTVGLILILFLKTEELFLAKFSFVFSLILNVKLSIKWKTVACSSVILVEVDRQTDRQTERTEFGTSSSGDGADNLICEILKVSFPVLHLSFNNFFMIKRLP